MYLCYENEKCINFISPLTPLNRVESLAPLLTIDLLKHYYLY